MSNKNLFEIATREGYRFPFRGMINVEDLWQLSVHDLDSIFKELNSQVKQIEEESLLNFKTEQDEELSGKIEIVKHIVQVKLDEAEARSKEIESAKQRQRIMEILANKQDEELLNKSPEELKEMLNELD